MCHLSNPTIDLWWDFSFSLTTLLNISYINMNIGKSNLQAREKALFSPSVAARLFRVLSYKVLRSSFEEHRLLNIIWLCGGTGCLRVWVLKLDPPPVGEEITSKFPSLWVNTQRDGPLDIRQLPLPRGYLVLCFLYKGLKIKCFALNQKSIWLNTRMFFNFLGYRKKTKNFKLGWS